MKDSILKNIAFFDLDGTLWPVSVEKSFASHLYRNGVLSTAQLLKVVWSYLRYEAGLIGDHDEFKKGILKQLFEGQNVAEVENYYEEYFETELCGQLFEDMVTVINRHKAKEDRVVLVSASLAFLVKRAADFLSADEYFGTELVVKDGHFTGEVADPIHYGSQKEVTISEYAAKINADLSQCYAYGDRREDEFMLRSVGHPVAVRPKKKLRDLADRKNWSIIESR